MADRAWEAIERISTSLSRSGANRGPSLFSGAAGVALFHHYASLAQGRSSERARRHLRLAWDGVGTSTGGLSLSGGATGIAFASCLVGAAEDEPYRLAVDRALLRHLRSRHAKADHFDLVSGWVGMAVYALERGGGGPAAEATSLLLRHLAATRRPSGSGITWRTSPRLIPAHQQAPRGYFNLGVAHGVPGIVAVLSRLCLEGPEVARDRSLALLEPAVEWLLAQQRVELGEVRYAPWTGPGIPLRPSRTAWCYGDLGISAVLTQVGRAAGRARWVGAARALARRILGRPLQSSRVVDAGLCHGAVGVAHVFNRLFQAHQDEAFADAARFWLTRALEEASLGGARAFRTAIVSPDGAVRWRRRPGLIDGLAGIGLGLLAAVSDVEPQWDRMLLVSAHAG